MKKAKLMVAVLLLAVAPAAAAQTLDELARLVREAAGSEARINQEREARFVRERDQQRELLAEARRELADENARSGRLKD
jgi:biopolymer transport protein ExbB